MPGLDSQWKALVKQLKKLEVDTRKARGDARVRLKKLDKKTRKMVEKALREAEPRVKQAMKDAARIGRVPADLPVFIRHRECALRIGVAKRAAKTFGSRIGMPVDDEDFVPVDRRQKPPTNRTN